MSARHIFQSQPLKSFALGIETELRFSTGILIAAYLAVGLIFVLIGEAQQNEAVRAQWVVGGLLLYGIAIAGWALAGWHTHISRWFLVIALAFSLQLGAIWLTPVLWFALAAVAVAVAIATAGPLAGVVLATLQSALLWVLPTAGLFESTPTETVVTCVALWTMCGIAVWQYRSVYWQIEWVWQHFEQAQRALHETRSRSAELAQVTTDLMHANRQLELLNERLAAARLAAEEAQQAKTAFVAKVSHEFRTPLNMLIGLTDLLIETPDVYGDDLSPDLKEDLKIVHRNCAHLASLVNDVLDLSQTESGYLTLHREWVDLRAEIESSLTVVRPLLLNKKLALQVDVAVDLPCVYCDRTRIRQVILNLLSNAARYTEQGRIELTVQQQEHNVVLCVADTGRGIAPADLAQIFEPFYQAAGNMWRDQEGSGLGLSISKQFIELHKGRLWVESEPGVGSAFSFQIPISPLAPRQAAPGQWMHEDWVWLERSAAPVVPKLPYRQRVVLCDENGSLAPFITQSVGEQVEILVTKTLSETMQHLDECPAHAVMFNTMPVKQLWECMHHARQLLPDTPIIGCCFPPRTDPVAELGVVAYLMKPIARTDLQQALAALPQPIRRILVVDDDPDVRRLLIRMLRAYDATYQIEAAANGAEALDKLVSTPFDLVLLDIVMPHLDGWQVLERKRCDARIAAIPVMITSAQDVVERPLKSDLVVTTMGQGFSPTSLLRCTLKMSELLLNPTETAVAAPDPARL